MNTPYKPNKEIKNCIPKSDEVLTHGETSVADIGIVIMASGEGKRFGSNKLLALLSEKPLIQYILDTTNHVPLRVVVTKYPEIAALCEKQDIPCILHDYPNRNDTIRLGVTYLEAAYFEKNSTPLPGIMFCQGDQPLLSKDTLQRFVQEACRHKRAFILQSKATSEENETAKSCVQFETNETVSGYMQSDVRFGSPVCFSSHFFQALKTLPKGKGGRILIQSNPDKLFPIPVSPQELLDVDTPTDLIEISKYLSL